MMCVFEEEEQCGHLADRNHIFNLTRSDRAPFKMHQVMTSFHDWDAK